jgi:hypothetical protein
MHGTTSLILYIGQFASVCQRLAFTVLRPGDQPPIGRHDYLPGLEGKSLQDLGHGQSFLHKYLSYRLRWSAACDSNHTSDCVLLHFRQSIRSNFRIIPLFPLNERQVAAVGSR